MKYIWWKMVVFFAVARDHFLGLMTDGIIEPLETSDSSMSLPNWFDEKKFDLGREYFMKNRFGILSTNLCGLVMLLALPKGLPIFRAAPKSDYIEGVRKRYLETIMNTLSWYEVQLKNGSRYEKDSRKPLAMAFISTPNKAANYNLIFQILGLLAED